MSEDISKALARFGSNELEAPTHQAEELAALRHYEVVTRIDTLCEAARAGIRAIVEARREIAQQGDMPEATRRELKNLEAYTYETACSIIRNLGYK